MVLGFLFSTNSAGQNTTEMTYEQKKEKLFRAIRMNSVSEFILHFKKYCDDLPDSYKDEDGNTLLHLSISHHREEIMKQLLKMKANMYIKNVFGITPMDNICKKRNRGMLDEYIKFLENDLLKRLDDLNNYKNKMGSNLSEYKLKLKQKTDTITKMENEINLLKKENSKLKMESTNLVQSNISLKQEINNLKRDNQSLNISYNKLFDLKNSSTTELTTVKNENVQLRTQFGCLNENNKRLREENNKLEGTNKNLKISINNFIKNAKKD